MAHLRSTELDADPHPIAFCEELLNLAGLHVNIMVICTWTHANLFQRDGFLILAGLVLFLCLLVFILTIVHQFADRWESIGRNLNQIEIALTGNIKRTLGGASHRSSPRSHRLSAPLAHECAH